MTKTPILIIVIISTLFISCKSDIKTNYGKKYLRWIGDIEHDTSRDNNNFRVCNGDDNIKQYFNLGYGPVYVDEKPSILKLFKTKYKSKLDKSQNGLIRIRFIVNCEGIAGRFRILQADSNYNETKFDKKIIAQLTEITKGIEEWIIQYTDDNKPIDYYYYFIFRIIDGQITEILP